MSKNPADQCVRGVRKLAPLFPKGFHLISLFEGVEKIQKEENLNKAKDFLNARFGQFALTTASSLFYQRRKRGKRRGWG